MTSLRKIARCIGLPANFSLVRDFFGHQQMPESFRVDQVTGTRSYSLRHQIMLLDSFHIHVNLILVGHEHFTTRELGDLDVAVFASRWIYAKVGLGIGRVRWFAIPLAEALGLERIESDDEAEALTNWWSVPNDALDVFIIREGWFDDEAQGGRKGISVAGASCDKNSTDGFSGSVVSLSGSRTSFTLPHEMAHDLGLRHIGGLEIEDIRALGVDIFPLSARENLMFPDQFAARVTLTAEQGNLMKTHCLIQPGCGIVS